MEIVEIRSTAVEGPDRVMISAEVYLDLGLTEMQRSMLEQGIDPLQLDNLEELMTLLKEQAIMSPFDIRDVRLSNASSEGLYVVMDLALIVEPRYPAEKLRLMYTRLLQAKLEQLKLEKAVARDRN